MSTQPNERDGALIKRAGEILQSEYDQHKEFNQAFDGDEPLELPSMVAGQEPYRLERSEALFWADRDAYYNELTQYDGQARLDFHAETIGILKTTNQNVVLNALGTAIQRGRVAPFIGAGLSAFKYPLWGKALETIRDNISGRLSKRRFQEAMDAGDYLQAADLLWKADHGEVKAQVSRLFSRNQVGSKNQITGPVLLLPEFSHGCIITTNFDSIIEMVMGAFDGYMNGLQQPNKFASNLIQGERCLLKLHGDPGLYDTYVLTQKQYDEAYGKTPDFTKPLPKALRQIYVSHSLLFLGCSLEQDRTLGLFETIVKTKQFDIPEHYAILPEPSTKSAKRAKQRRLEELHIMPLWYPSGKHDFVEKYLKLAMDVGGKRITLE